MSKVLFVDDSIAVRKVAERQLREVGLEVTLAANGEEALSLLTKEQPDLIISDVIMPGKNGYEVCSFVRSQASLTETPVLLISGIINEEVTREVKSCRADAVMKKPFQGTALKDQALELIAKRQKEAASSVQPAGASPSTPPPGVVIQITEAQYLAFNQATARIQELEVSLAKEQERVKELDAALVSERDAATQLVNQLGELDRAAGRIKEVESQLTQARETNAQLNQKLRDAEHAAANFQARKKEISLKLAEIATLSQWPESP